MIKRFSHKEILEVVEELLIKVGLDQEYAHIVGDSLVTANLRGVDTHGIRCLSNYIKRFEHGSLNINPEMDIVSENNIITVVDGDNALGHFVGSKCMDKAIDKAKNYGVGITSAKNSNHFGTTAYFSMKAIDKNYIGIAMTNATSRLAPTGGITPCYGNNPFSIAVPSSKKSIVLDMAISVVANSHIIIAREKEEKIPLGWALTKNGEPTNDPNLAELLVPIGGYKGYGIALMIEILTGVLSGASFGKDVGYYNSMDEGQDLGHLFIALDIEQFMTISEFDKRINKYIEEIKSSKLASDNEEGVFLPGEKELITYNERMKNGIPVKDNLLKEINHLCDTYKVEKNLSTFG